MHKDHYIFTFVFLTLFAACKSEMVKEAPTVEQTKKTQAIILKQDFDFDPTDKDRIAGDYVSVDKLVIPSNYIPQSKWIMFEGPVVENDLVAYRYYADSRHRFDIYGKKVSDLVMDTVSWDYHDVMDWGSDILKVGNSLGIGSPAIFYNDSLYTFSVYQEKVIEVSANADNKSSVKTTIKGLQVGEHSFDLVQDWHIEAGKPWSEIELHIIDGELPEGMFFATGIVKHLEDIDTASQDNFFYAMNWGKQSFHEQNLGMAISTPSEYDPEMIEDNLNHAMIMNNAPSSVKYKLISVWEQDGNKVNDQAGFEQIVRQSYQ